ncbi:uncharacterized protein MYCFIDRAFT_195666 [Pseudocercospora fijiensis CIRAD86]|uniref:Calcineurin-like phosphoesterase domain-containing protein n=1 Tax=Pseudocercospora fijiensis (strain CIRAD86) TaxID=383855 RepID=M2Z4E4_PSEFD|nr:uncharacterized protein MYCFIDRAFT_195666 [Pseudocercospora fijiensis CIRAD86]EME84680.1 hypothetical protein MYCFIDRAFT_195666 [Pseudocercospora fijiensis CIRAD86]
MALSRLLFGNGGDVLLAVTWTWAGIATTLYILRACYASPQIAITVGYCQADTFHPESGDIIPGLRALILPTVTETWFIIIFGTIPTVKPVFKACGKSVNRMCGRPTNNIKLQRLIYDLQLQTGVGADWAMDCHGYQPNMQVLSLVAVAASLATDFASGVDAAAKGELIERQSNLCGVKGTRILPTIFGSSQKSLEVLAQCGALSESTSLCKSFAVDSTSCYLYPAALTKEIKQDPSESFTYYDISCITAIDLCCVTAQLNGMLWFVQEDCWMQKQRSRNRILHLVPPYGREESSRLLKEYSSFLKFQLCAVLCRMIRSFGSTENVDAQSITLVILRHSTEFADSGSRQQAAGSRQQAAGDMRHSEDDEESLTDLKARLLAEESKRKGQDRNRTSVVDGSAPYEVTTSPRGEEKQLLINQVNNRWRSEKDTGDHDADLYGADDERHLGFCDLDDDKSCPNSLRHLSASRRFRRMIALLILLATASYYIWSRFIQPRLAEEWAYKQGFVSQEGGTYGIAKGGHGEKDMVRIQYLESSLLPGGDCDPNGERRLVFIGDIHGCKKELLELLQKAGYNEETDHLILVGDVVTKGPDNVGVLDELIRLNATSVRGNHEDRLLHVAKKLHMAGAHDIEATGSKGKAKDIALVKQLQPHHLQYLQAMPLMLHIPALPMASGSTRKSNSPITEHMLVVHAGLVPGVRLNKQDPYFVMNMRSINRRTHVPSALRAPSKNAKPWYDIWCWYNDRIFKKLSLTGFEAPDSDMLAQTEPDTWFTGFWKNFFGQKKNSLHPQVVIYGHDSKAGLQINRWSKGLDSGCVGGGRLTAMVLDARGKQQLFHVGCENYRN